MTHSDLLALIHAVPQDRPQPELVWQAMVDVGERTPLGLGPQGERWIVPIVGGIFIGGPGHESLHGTVPAGGADRQVLRPDGVKQLDAQYEMHLHDGTVLTVHNRVTIDEHQSPRYARSQVSVTAPEGPHAWLNRRCLVGTLQTLRPHRAAVLVRVYQLR